MIRFVKLFEIAAMTIAAWGFLARDATVLLSVLFLMGLHSTLFGPIKYAILPQALHANELVGGNGMVEMGTSMAILLGMLLGDGEAPAASPGGVPRLGYMRSATPGDAAAYPASDPATLKRFPPTLVVVGTRDFAMSSAVNLHSRLVAQGVDARLHVWEGGRHAFFYDARVPESREAYAVMARFFHDRLK